MATWIVHLRLAERLIDRIEGLDPSYFAIGNIAPDSGIPDKNWEKFDPPAEVLHFQAVEGESWCIADLDFYRCYLLPLKGVPSDQLQFSFLLGYFFHLVTDNLWETLIGKPTRERFAPQFESDPKFVWQVKRDWYGLDFEHVLAHRNSLFWRVFLNCQYEHDYLDFLPPEAVQIRIDYIKEFYQRTDGKVQEWYGRRPGKYLTGPEVVEFIDTATSTLMSIHTHLWLKADEVPDTPSSLYLGLNYRDVAGRP
jgi:hypothetical protein